MNAKRRAASLLLGVLFAACGSTPTSPTPAGSSPPAPSPTPIVTASRIATPASAAPAPPSSEPTPLAPTPAPSDPLLGKVVVTVSDNLVVRSEPRVSDDSIMYEPWLPLDTELTVLDGPVSASGYTWYQVAPVSFAGLSGPGSGWVAMAGKDGEAWIALATNAPGVALAQANVARATANPKDAKTAAASVTAFGLDLYRALLTDPNLNLGTKNVVFSPTSIALALGMARAGAKGETASQMDTVLHTSGWDALGAGLNALDRALASRDATWQDSSFDPPARQLSLRIANAAFGQQGWTIEQPYLERIAAAFGSGLRLLDYKADPEAARMAINAWVSNQTAKRIPQLIPKATPPLIDMLTRLVLVNAIYLKASWENEFEKSETRAAPFTRLDGSRADVPTMHAEFHGDVPYASGKGWRATELLYLAPNDSTRLAMTLVLPDDLSTFRKSLSTSQLTKITAAIAAQREVLAQAVVCAGDTTPPQHTGYAVDLFLPRFGIETRGGLGPVLEGLGMPLALTRGVADFSGIHVPKSYEEILYISDVIHQANIDVDEKGTEAAAATAVEMGATGGGCGPDISKTITLRLDHPFLFFVRDLETGAVLFMGQVTDPSVGKGS